MTSLPQAVHAFADDVARKFAALAAGQPEDQLRGPTERLLAAAGQAQGIAVVAKDESPLPDQAGRPDFAVTVGGLLCGYVELKAPGTGVETQRFTGHNRNQWRRFAQLPNLVYTDGNDWALYRSGECLRRARLAGDVTKLGARAYDDDAIAALDALLRDFYAWQPLVPGSARQLADLIAPLCRLLRDDVRDALGRHSPAMRAVAHDWREYLFPDASDAELADSYAQTVVFALLLARSDGSDTLVLDQAVAALTHANSLLARALQVLTDPQLQADIGASVALVQRVVRAVPPGTMTHGRRDPWLHFYEDFLAAYDPALRKNAGAYYTPVEVVQAQVRLVDALLRQRLGKRFGFADAGVATLDPAVGTGTYLLGIVEHVAEQVRTREGAGALPGRAHNLARQLYGFELMVGPYAVAALRLTRALRDAGAPPLQDGVNVFLTNTLESPHEKIPELPLLYRPIGEQHRRARDVKAQTPVLVCIGNPPYDRHGAADAANRAATGAWVRWGEARDGADAILRDYAEPVRAAGKGGQLKNLYNLYVYFWRWALWKVFETPAPGGAPGAGVVSFITAASYLDGDAFAGMRAHLRRTCDEVWVVDLGGEGRGTRQDDNVFAIQTPVAIAIAARYGAPDPDTPATVHYCRLEGSRAEKLDRLERVQDFADLHFDTCPGDWSAPLRPRSTAAFFDWPALTGLMPWQHSGVEAKRTWPIAPEAGTLPRRWRALLAATDRRAAYRESSDQTVHNDRAPLFPGTLAGPIAHLAADSPCPPVRPYGFRFLDRQFLIADGRVLARPREPLWRTASTGQLYFSSLLTSPLGNGPGLAVSADVPDRHHFSGRGAKDLLPLWRDAAATQPNLHPRLLETLAAQYGRAVTAPDVAAYLYGVLAQPAYTARFAAELQNRAVHVPVTLDGALFETARALGARLLYLHTFGERFAAGQTWPVGQARCTHAVVAEDGVGLPQRFAYDAARQVLHVGSGQFAPVAPAVWAFEVSGLKVVQSWLGYRMRARKGRKSSPLDDIVPDAWPADYTTELLALLHLLEETVATQPAQARLLEQILAGPLLPAGTLGPAPDAARQAPASAGAQTAMSLHPPGF